MKKILNKTDTLLILEKYKKILPKKTLDVSDDFFATSKKINYFLNKGMVSIVKDYTLNRIESMNKAKLQRAIDASTEPLKTKLDNITSALKEKINRINGSEETKKVQEEVEILKRDLAGIHNAQTLILEKLDKLSIVGVSNKQQDMTKTYTTTYEKPFVIEEDEVVPVIKSDLDTKNIKKKKIKVKSKSSKKNVDDAIAKLKSIKRKK